MAGTRSSPKTEAEEPFPDPLNEAIGPESRWQALIAACQIKVLDKEKVALILPEGMSRADFLQQVQSVASDEHGRNAIYPCCLEQWATEKDFTAKPSQEIAIAIEGHVEGSTRKARDEQVVFLDKRYLQMPDLRDLAVAHAAYFLATGKDLFNGYVVRARGGALYFISPGLNVHNYTDDRRHSNVAASACLPAQNSTT